MAFGINELLLAGLAFKALGGSSSTKPAAPPPPPPPNRQDDLGQQVAGTVGGLAGTALTAVLSGAGGGSTGVGAGTGGAVSAATTTAATAGSSAAAEVGVGGTFASTIGLGGGLVLGWLAIVVIQFIVMDIVNTLRNQWLRYTAAVKDLNRPFIHLQKMEELLVEQACKQIGLRWDPNNFTTGDDDGIRTDTAGHHNDTRLTFDPGAGGSMLIGPQWRHIFPNPFPPQGLDLRAPDGTAVHVDAAAGWRFLQMAARYVAASYCYDLGTYGRNLWSNFPPLGHVGQAPPSTFQWSALELWNYPLLGGGQPDKDEPSMRAELEAGPQGPSQFSTATFFIHQSARLAAALHAMATCAMDVGLDNDPDHYARVLQQSIQVPGTFWNGDIRIFFSPILYGLPPHFRSMWVDVHFLKGGTLPCSPFQSDGSPTQHGYTWFEVSDHETSPIQ